MTLQTFFSSPYNCKDQGQKYRYELNICQKSGNMVAVKQTEIKTGSPRNAGKYEGATVKGGSKCFSSKHCSSKSGVWFIYQKNNIIKSFICHLELSDIS
jgi:hypothetical protein